MSCFGNLVKTYDLCLGIVGRSSGEDHSKMLLPIGHLLTNRNIVVHLKEDGTFYDAEQETPSGKDKGKKYLTCIPCTEDSESRSGKDASDYPHPLFDQIKFFNEKYLRNLKSWVDYTETSRRHPLAFRALSAVYKYMRKGTLKNDLKLRFRKEPKIDDFVVFTVDLSGSLENRLWEMPEIRVAWIDYLLANMSKEKEKIFCYVTGEEDYFTEKHPKSINRVEGNAKLITSNDNTNFTFRGRFEKASQSVTVSYLGSQKAHQMLRWLIANNGYCCGSQAIVAWAIDKNPNVPSFYKDSKSLYLSLQKKDEAEIEAEDVVFQDYSVKLKEALLGYISAQKIKENIRRVAILATEPSTTGRLAITYYREFLGTKDEYEERIINWHEKCKWYQRPLNRRTFKGAPSFDMIVRAVLGSPRSENDESFQKLKKGLNKQLLYCVFDGQKVPLPWVRSAVNRCSNPLALEKSGDSFYERFSEWEEVLGTTCALVKKFFFDYGKEVIPLELDTTITDRDYLYGRLLAIADQIESHARYLKGKSDSGATNALRYMFAFSQRPFRTWNLLFSKQLNPYIQQLDGAEYYMKLIGSIMEKFKPEDFNNDAPLNGKYLMGFFAQRQVFKNSKKDKEEGGEINESEQQN